MNDRMRDGFIFSVAIILFITAAAKLFSAPGTAVALDSMDPILPLSNRWLFYLAGGIELLISGFLLIKTRGHRIKLTLIAWLATDYLVYRAGLWWSGSPNLCDCLGDLNDRLSISPRILNRFTLAALIWLSAGSGLFLIRDLTRNFGFKTSLEKPDNQMKA
jgi:hypothetical protein